MLLAALCVCVSAGAVTVDFYTSPGPDGSASGLNLGHALIANGADGDRNGQFDSFSQTQFYTGDGIPDGLQFSVLEYFYGETETSHHALATAAYDQNLAALIAWNGGVCLYPNGDGPGSSEGNPVYGPRFAFADITYCDLFDGFVTPLCFAGCTPGHALIREMAAYITISEFDIHASSKWGILNFGESVDFDTDHRFNRSAASVFGHLGDLDGDGFTNLDEFESVERAVRFENPSLQNPAQKLWLLLSRAQKDQVIGRYIDVAAFTPGLDPGDPNPPSPTVTSQSGNKWVEESPSDWVRLEVTLRYAQLPVTYQWYKDGVALADSPTLNGSAARVLIIGPPLAISDSGVYTCVAQDQSPGKAAISSAPIHLQVFPAGSLPAPAAGTAVALVLAAAGLRHALRRRRIR